MARRAFNLLETCLVVIVTGTAAAVAVPRLMGSTRHTRLQGAAFRLAQDIESARERARTLGVYQTMCFSGEGYVLIERTADAEEKREVSLSGDPYRCTIAWVSLTSGTDLSFDGFGVPSASAVVKLTNGREVFLVSIAGGSGAVTTSPLMSKPQGDAVSPPVAPVAMPSDVDSIVPPIRANTKVRYGSTSFDTDISVSVTEIDSEAK